MKAPLADTVRQDLLRVARQAILRAIGAEPAPLIPDFPSPSPRRGVFVTLRVVGVDGSTSEETFSSFTPGELVRGSRNL